LRKYFAAYKSVLESYSLPLLGLIEWEPTAAGNVRVLNENANYYRYFDATAHAEFLYHCVEQTIEQDLPQEVAYLEAYDRFSKGLQEIVDAGTKGGSAAQIPAPAEWPVVEARTDE
jgi:hypothetical protein